MLTAGLVFLALLGLAAFLAQACRVPPALAPLVSLSALMVWLSAAGALNSLPLGGWLALAACLALPAALLWRRGGKGAARQLFAVFRNPGFLLFSAGGALLLLYLGFRQPLFSQWDEFSFWGTAVKLTKLEGRLYPFASDIGWHRVSTQHPALVVLAWFFQLPAEGFAAWKVYFSTDLLYLAAASAAVGLLNLKQLRAALPVAAAALLAPHFFSVTYRLVYPAGAWISAYADLPSGALLGGALAAWFARRWAMERAGEAPRPLAQAAGRRTGEGGALAGLWQPLLPLAALALTKENNLPIALVAAGIMAADALLFFPREKGFALPRRALAAGLALAAPLLAYAGWKIFAGVIIAGSQPAVVQGTQYTGSGAADSGGIVSIFTQLLGLAPRTPRFSAALAHMANYLVGEKISMLGGAVPQNIYDRLPLLGGALPTVAVVLGLFLAAALLCKQRRWRLRVLCAAGLSTAGWLGWQLSLLFAYTYVFTGPIEEGLADYSRYMGSYYLGWFLLALVFFAEALRRAVPESLRATLGRGAAVALPLAMLVLFAALVPPGTSALDYSDRIYDGQRELAAQAQAIRAAAQPEDRIFYVGQGEDGEEWYMLLYHLLPQRLDYSLTGGASLVAPPAGHREPDAPEDGYTSLAELDAYLEESGCRLLYIHRMDESFEAAYGALFGDGLAEARRGPALYRRGEDGLYRPV